MIDSNLGAGGCFRGGFLGAFPGSRRGGQQASGPGRLRAQRLCQAGALGGGERRRN
ncbi:hypothetical protein ACRQDV_07740 [Actinotignum sp. GS-2025e]|uniref:hypothetical protein n=1 Tax=Actinotignum sp. GS-2025e TaxID=3427278 RepID=UPI003F45022E